MDCTVCVCVCVCGGGLLYSDEGSRYMRYSMIEALELTDKIIAFEGVKQEGMDALCECEPTDFSACVSIPYCHGTGGHQDCQQVLTRILKRGQTI